MTEEDPFARFSEVPVRIVPYDPASLALYEAYSERLRDLIGTDACIELRGSTALGLPGKGELDINIIADGAEAFGQVREILIEAYGPPGSDEADFLRFNDRAGDTEIEILVKVRDSEGERAERAFMDYLKAHPEACGRYVEIKRKYAFSRREYYRQKDRFYREILAAASSGDE